MVTPWLLLGLELAVLDPSPYRRHAPALALAVGARVGWFEGGFTTTAGFVWPTYVQDHDEDLGVGWALAPGLRAGAQLPVAGIVVRPFLSGAYDHRDHSTWYDERHVRQGFVAAAGAEVALPTRRHTWCQVGARGAWSTLDEGPMLVLAIGVGAEIAARD